MSARQKILFDREGRYLLGKHRGVHVSKLEPGFVSWAGTNIEGFREQYQILARGDSLPLPKPVQVPHDTPTKPKGRTYFLSKTRRMYIPTHPDE